MIKFNDKPELSFTFRNLKRTQFKTLSLDQNSDILHPTQFDSALVEEIPVVITVNDISHAVMMMTPCNLESFVIGFAFSEQLIDSVSDIRDIVIEQVTQHYGESLTINLELSPKCFFLFKKSRKVHLGSTGCGLCGVESLEKAFPDLDKLQTCDPISSDLLPSLRQQLSDLQTLGRESGAIHAALLLSPTGEVISCMEDIGRHNALDKVIGYALSHEIDLYQCSVVLSSRCSSELVQKAVRAGLSRLIHLASPSNMAVTMARKSGLHLIHLPKQDAPRQYSPVSKDEKHE